MLLKKEAEVKRTRLKTAVSFYNAAVGFFNAGVKEKARDYATMALGHPSLKNPVEELIKKID